MCAHSAKLNFTVCGKRKLCRMSEILEIHFSGIVRWDPDWPLSFILLCSKQGVTEEVRSLRQMVWEGTPFVLQRICIFRSHFSKQELAKLSIFYPSRNVPVRIFSSGVFGHGKDLSRSQRRRDRSWDNGDLLLCCLLPVRDWRVISSDRCCHISFMILKLDLFAKKYKADVAQA